MKKIVLYSVFFLSIIAATLFLSGCNTMEGVGKDVQTLGKGISGVAD